MAIADHWALHDYGPSVREIAQAVQLASSSSVVYWLRGLIAAGLVVQSKAARSIRLTPAGREVLKQRCAA